MTAEASEPSRSPFISVAFDKPAPERDLCLETLVAGPGAELEAVLRRGLRRAAEDLLLGVDDDGCLAVTQSPSSRRHAFDLEVESTSESARIVMRIADGASQVPAPIARLLPRFSARLAGHLVAALGPERVRHRRAGDIVASDLDIDLTDLDVAVCDDPACEAFDWARASPRMGEEFAAVALDIYFRSRAADIAAVVADVLSRNGVPASIREGRVAMGHPHGSFFRPELVRRGETSRFTVWCALHAGAATHVGAVSRLREVFAAVAGDLDAHYATAEVHSAWRLRDDIRPLPQAVDIARLECMSTEGTWLGLRPNAVWWLWLGMAYQPGLGSWWAGLPAVHRERRAGGLLAWTSPLPVAQAFIEGRARFAVPREWSMRMDPPYPSLYLDHMDAAARGLERFAPVEPAERIPWSLA